MKLTFSNDAHSRVVTTKLPREVWDNSALSTTNQDYDILPCSSQSEDAAERDLIHLICCVAGEIAGPLLLLGRFRTELIHSLAIAE